MFQVDIRVNGVAIGGAAVINRGCDGQKQHYIGVCKYEGRAHINGEWYDIDVEHNRSDGAPTLARLIMEQLENQYGTV